MSRHRNVRNLDVADELYDDEEDDYYDDEEYFDEDDDEYSQKSVDALVREVQDVLGSSFPSQKVKSALEKNNFNVERTIDLLLNGPKATPAPVRPPTDQYGWRETGFFTFGFSGYLCFGRTGSSSRSDFLLSIVAASKSLDVWRYR
ncbi:hypothetical protein BJ742DRAFT_256665 [Cladochytrium replicatum]|nr:hypothetical protein BJ742DRAFT_256665 [Cladochytrium replicatum]